MTRVHDVQALGLQRLTIVAGITGLASDAQTMAETLAGRRVSRILLGVPYEDLDAIRATSGKEDQTEFESADLDDAYLNRLKIYAPVQSPPPDLYVAYRYAETHKIPLDAIDLGDEAYTEAYTKHVGFLEVMRSNRRHRRAPDTEIEAEDADAFIVAWDDLLNDGRGLRKVQGAREQAMVDAIAAAAKEPGVVALVPLVRAHGILQRLEEAGWRPA